MNISQIRFFLTAVFLTVHLSACDTIAKYFPDKEKDYHYHTELPPLELPPDLQAKSDQERKFTGVTKKPEASAKPTSADQTINMDPVRVRMVKYDDGSVRLQIESSLKKAWPIVGKALSRNLIEITDRNRSEAVFFVQYDPDAKKYEDGTLGDEFEFFFGDNPRQEKEYHIWLAEEDNLTEVMVADEKDTPLADGDGIKLLRTLYETIKDDQEKKAGE
jgi:outer membrane protein assembly factor BamC